jgi:hypothetical protein
MLDKIIVSGFSAELGKSLMEKVFYDCCKILGLESKDFLPMKNAKGYPRYWSRDYGIDIKFEKNFFFGIEFQSTFFCFPDAFEIVKLVILYFSDEIGFRSLSSIF